MPGLSSDLAVFADVGELIYPRVKTLIQEPEESNAGRLRTVPDPSFSVSTLRRASADEIALLSADSAAETIGGGMFGFVAC